jgi:hypothetical protein
MLYNSTAQQFAVQQYSTAVQYCIVRVCMQSCSDFLCDHTRASTQLRLPNLERMFETFLSVEPDITCVLTARAVLICCNCRLAGG